MGIRFKADPKWKPPIWFRIFSIGTVVNFAVFWAVAVISGGDALNGKIEGGRYFLASHGNYTEVTRGFFLYSRVHALSSAVAILLTVFGGFWFIRRHQRKQPAVRGVEFLRIDPVSPRSSAAEAMIAQLDREILDTYPGQPVHGFDAVEFDRTGGYFVVAQESAVIGCGAFRAIDRGRAEIQRMFVAPEARRRGVARSILRHLEAEICRRGYSTIILETGIGQPAAIGLYESEGFVPIPAYGEFVDCALSRCYEKKV